MLIAIASGKGGTGKTTIATNLAVTLAKTMGKTAYYDCDVEEPNGHLFLNLKLKTASQFGIPCPVVDESKCTSCGKCGEICQYSAIVSLKAKPVTFEKLCHGCGGCTLVCPEGAITEVNREIGVLEKGYSNKLKVIQGKLHVGEAMSPPLIRAVKSLISKDEISIIDASPGTSCPVITAIKGAAFGLLVTEPTPFGLNDLVLAVNMFREMDFPFATIINRSDMGDDRVEKYCERENIPVVLKIKEDRKVAEAYSRGQLAVNAVPAYKDYMEHLIKYIFQHETFSNKRES